MTGPGRGVDRLRDGPRGDDIRVPLFRCEFVEVFVSVARSSMAAPTSLKSKAVLGSSEDCLLESSRSCSPRVRLSPLASGGSEIDTDGIEDRPTVEDFGVDAPELLHPTVKVNAGLGLLSIEAMGSEAGVWLGAKAPLLIGPTLPFSIPSLLPARKANVLGTLPDVGVTFPDTEHEAGFDRGEITCCTISIGRGRGRHSVGMD